MSDALGALILIDLYVWEAGSLEQGREKRETSLNSNDNLVDLSFYGSLKLKGMRQE